MDQVALLNGKVEPIELCDVQFNREGEFAVLAVKISEIESCLGNDLVSIGPALVLDASSRGVEFDSCTIAKRNAGCVQFLTEFGA
jgi:hypothetical protein